MLTESIARMDKEKAVPVTTAQLQETGIRHLDLRDTYTAQINFVCATLESNGRQITPGISQPTGLLNKDINLAHIVDTPVLLSQEHRAC